MGTIIVRKRKDSSVSFLARIWIIRDWAPYHETETYDRRAAATSSMRKRERELARPGAIAQAKAEGDATLARAIDRYTRVAWKDFQKEHSECSSAT